MLKNSIEHKFCGAQEKAEHELPEKKSGTKKAHLYSLCDSEQRQGFSHKSDTWDTVPVA